MRVKRTFFLGALMLGLVVAWVSAMPQQNNSDDSVRGSHISTGNCCGQAAEDNLCELAHISCSDFVKQCKSGYTNNKDCSCDNTDGCTDAGCSKSHCDQKCT